MSEKEDITNLDLNPSRVFQQGTQVDEKPDHRGRLLSSLKKARGKGGKNTVSERVQTQEDKGRVGKLVGAGHVLTTTMQSKCMHAWKEAEKLIYTTIGQRKGREGGGLPFSSSSDDVASLVRYSLNSEMHILVKSALHSLHVCLAGAFNLGTLCVVLSMQ